MPNSKNYIEEYGNITFADYPFCDADALALAEVFYMPLEQVVSSSFDEVRDFPDACRELFALRGNKHSPLGLMITKAPSIRLMLMADTRRFGEMKITGVEEVFSREPAIQYAAGTFLLPNGDGVVVFRGTDDTIAGWVEDLDIEVRRGTPAYDLALEYIEKAAGAIKGKIYLSGHSKGGNIALRTAVLCSEEIRKRIAGVYNFDGPGYHNYHLFGTAAYNELLPGYRHFVPTSSMVGMMLCHDYDYKAVKSSRITGAFQHDLGSWQISDGELVLKDDTNFMAKITDVFLSELIAELNETTLEAVDRVVTAITQATDIVTLTELAGNIKTAVKGAAGAYKSIDDETKADFKAAFDGVGKLMLWSVRNFKEKTADKAAEFIAAKIIEAI